MTERKLGRLLGTALLVDGVLLLAFSRAYVRRWHVGPTASSYRRAMAWLAARPAWLLRLAGAAEAALGLVALGPLGVRTLYRVWSKVYDRTAWVWRDWAYPDAQRVVDGALAAHLPPGGRVLDLGCGTGVNLERLLALRLPFSSYVGADLSEDMLARARAKFSHLASARFHQLDLAVDPLPEGPFDLVVSTRVFEHLPNPARVVEKAWERLQPGGHIILLFQTEVGAWPDRLLRPLWRCVSARLLREDEYRCFPGLLAVDRLARGLVALVVLRKP